MSGRYTMAVDFDKLLTDWKRRIKSSMKLAVLMTCYNRYETTIKCLERLKEATSRVKELALSIFLVDDCSPDETGAKIKVAYPEITVIKGTGGLYWCKGMHLAWKTAVATDDFDAYLWLNDDVILNPEAIANIVSDGEATENEGAVVGAFLSRNGVMTYGVLEDWQWIDPMGVPRETKGDISGNLVYIPRVVYQRVGLIANDYSHAYGDYDYSARMRRAGVKYYLASKICGQCNDEKPIMALESKSLIERLSYLFKPCAHNLRDGIVYRWRYYGLWRTILTAGHIIYLVVRGKVRSA